MIEQTEKQMPSDSTGPYDTIARVSPIIEGTPEITDRMKACFDFVEKIRDGSGAEKPYELIGSGKNRYVFGNFTPVTDPHTGKKEFFVMKLVRPDAQIHNFESFYTFKPSAITLCSLFHPLSELDALEQKGECFTPGIGCSLLGIVLDYRPHKTGHKHRAGLLMTDHSEGGRYIVENDEDRDGMLKVMDGQKRIKTIYGDMKRDLGNSQNAEKYLYHAVNLR